MKKVQNFENWKPTVAELLSNGEAMLSHGWSVDADSAWPNYVWTSPRGDSYVSNSGNTPSIRAVEDAQTHGDYFTTAQVQE